MLDTSQIAGESYVALSHCGGDDPTQLTLNSSNMYILSQGIPSLPPNFLEAVHIARALGIQFLWDRLALYYSIRTRQRLGDRTPLS